MAEPALAGFSQPLGRRWLKLPFEKDRERPSEGVGDRGYPGVNTGSIALRARPLKWPPRKGTVKQTPVLLGGMRSLATSSQRNLTQTCSHKLNLESHLSVSPEVLQ